MSKYLPTITKQKNKKKEIILVG